MPRQYVAKGGSHASTVAYGGLIPQQCGGGEPCLSTAVVESCFLRTVGWRPNLPKGGKPRPNSAGGMGARALKCGRGESQACTARLGGELFLCSAAGGRAIFVQRGRGTIHAPTERQKTRPWLCSAVGGRSMPLQYGRGEPCHSSAVGGETKASPVQ